jgi:hypothetical protein
VFLVRKAASATGAASSGGYPSIPQLMAGTAMLRISCSAASRMLRR